MDGEKFTHIKEASKKVGTLIIGNFNYLDIDWKSIYKKEKYWFSILLFRHNEYVEEF